MNLINIVNYEVLNNKYVWYLNTEYGEVFFILEISEEDATLQNSGVSRDVYEIFIKDKDVCKLAQLYIISYMNKNQMNIIFDDFEERILSGYEIEFLCFEPKMICLDKMKDNLLKYVFDNYLSEKFELYDSNLFRFEKIEEIDCMLRLKNIELWCVSAKESDGTIYVVNDYVEQIILYFSVNMNKKLVELCMQEYTKICKQTKKFRLDEVKNKSELIESMDVALRSILKSVLADEDGEEEEDLLKIYNLYI